MALRSRTATLLRLIIAPFIFILLTFVVDKALSADTDSRLFYNDTGNTTNAIPVTPIPPCETELYGVQPCWDYFYTPSTDPIAQVSALEPVVVWVCVGRKGRW